ncbi:MAG: DUF4198 domain-containing protein [Phycisphaerales bacterium]
MRLVRGLAVVAASLASASAALAHVFWIQPASFTPAVGEVVGVQLRVGDELPGEVLPRDEQRIVRFVALGPSTPEASAIAGRQGRDPAGMVRFTVPGVHVLAYQSTPTPVTLAGDKFEGYLKEKGLEKISKMRAERGQSRAEAREIYSRSVKSIIAVGGQRGSGFDASAGLRFEVVPLSDPTALRAGETLRVRFVFEGKPLVGALVQARGARHSGPVIEARTNEQGEAALTLPEAGMWLVDAVEMVAAPAGSGAEWESVWASLSFSTADAPKAATPTTKGLGR